MAKNTAVNLYNRRRQPIVLNLPYQECGDLTFCHRQTRGKVAQMTDGTKRVKPENARLSKSLYLRGKGKNGDCALGVPIAALKAPEVKAAIARGDLRIEKLLEGDANKQKKDRDKAANKAAMKAPNKAPKPTSAPEDENEDQAPKGRRRGGK